MPVLDFVVSLVWIGGLALVLVGKAVLAWFRFRHAARSALHARRLAEATKLIANPAAERAVADIRAFRNRQSTVPATPKPGV